MKTTMKAALFGGAIFAAGIANQANAQSYRLGGPTGQLQTDTGGYANNWSWDATTYGSPGPYGGYMTEFRAACDSPYLFGRFFGAPSGTRVTTSDVNTLDIFSLNEVDGLVIPWAPDGSFGANYDLGNAYISYFFSRGGDLLIFADSSYNDPVNSYLGIPTDSANTQYISNGLFPAFDGPFGPAVNVQQAGAYGTLNLADVTATGGRVIGTNGLGGVTVAFWDEGDFCPTCGAMIIATDVDMITSRFGVADYNALNDNARFALNSVAALFGDGPPEGADCDGNGVLNIDDIDCFVDAFLSGDL